MQKAEPKKIIAYSVLAIFLTFASFLLFYFFRATSFIQAYDLIIAIIFIISGTLLLVAIFKLEVSLLIFIFLVPLLGSLPYILGNNHDFPIIYFMFLGMFLGGLIYYLRKYKSLTYLKFRIYAPVFIFIILSLVSFIFTFARLINFFPFYDSQIEVYTVNVVGWNNFISMSYMTSAFLNYFSGFLLFFIFINIVISKKFIKYFFYALSAGFLVVFLIGLVQIFFKAGFGNIDYWTQGGRINSLLTDPNSLGGYVFMMFPIFIGFGYYFYRRQKYFSIAAFIMSVFALFLMQYSGSRTSFVGFVIILLFYFIYLGAILIRKIFKKTNLRRVLLNVISYMIIIVILAGLLFAAISVIENIKFEEGSTSLWRRIQYDIIVFKEHGPAGSFTDQYSANKRNILWKQAFNMFIDHPISGVGIGQYSTEISNYNMVKYGITGITDIASNYYLQVVSEMGIIPLAIILWFFIEVLSASIIVYRKIINKRFKFLYLNFLLCFIVALLIFNTGPNVIFFEIQYMFFIIIGFLVNFRINFTKKDYKFILNEN